MKKANKTSPNQVDFSFEAAPPKTSRDIGAEIVSLSDYAASVAQSKRALLDQAIMARAAHLPLRRAAWNSPLRDRLAYAGERIIRYLSDSEIAINAIFFRVFRHGADQLLSRTWFIDPGEPQADVATTTRHTEGSSTRAVNAPTVSAFAACAGWWIFSESWS